MNPFGCLVALLAIAMTVSALAAPEVIVWGWNEQGQMDAPAELNDVVAIAAVDVDSLALLSDGRVAVWGNSWYGQTNIPSELINVVTIAAGGS